MGEQKGFLAHKLPKQKDAPRWAPYCTEKVPVRHGDSQQQQQKMQSPDAISRFLEHAVMEDANLPQSADAANAIDLARWTPELELELELGESTELKAVVADTNSEYVSPDQEQALIGEQHEFESYLELLLDPCSIEERIVWSADPCVQKEVC